MKQENNGQMKQSTSSVINACNKVQNFDENFYLASELSSDFYLNFCGRDSITLSSEYTHHAKKCSSYAILLFDILPNFFQPYF